jgi:hypothetical protein
VPHRDDVLVGAQPVTKVRGEGSLLAVIAVIRYPRSRLRRRVIRIVNARRYAARSASSRERAKDGV